jgi:hypothetical protein
MFLFISEVDGPRSAEEFTVRFSTELLGRFREQDIVAAAWIEMSADQRNIIQGFAYELDQRYYQREVYEASKAKVDRIIASIGWQPSTRIFLSANDLLPWAIFPGPTSPPNPGANTCDMPYNSHPLVPGKIKYCKQGHLFTDDHNITNCVECGGVLT